MQSDSAQTPETPLSPEETKKRQIRRCIIVVVVGVTLVVLMNFMMRGVEEEFMRNQSNVTIDWDHYTPPRALTPAEVAKENPELLKSGGAAPKKPGYYGQRPQAPKPQPVPPTGG